MPTNLKSVVVKSQNGLCQQLSLARSGRYAQIVPRKAVDSVYNLAWKGLIYFKYNIMILPQFGEIEHLIRIH